MGVRPRAYPGARESWGLKQRRWQCFLPGGEAGSNATMWLNQPLTWTCKMLWQGPSIGKGSSMKVPLRSPCSEKSPPWVLWGTPNLELC